MSRQMFRYVVPVDDEAHVFPLTSDPVAFAPIGDDQVEFWAEYEEDVRRSYRAFQVFGTGHPLPDGAVWVGTSPRTELGLVWHLYETTAVSTVTRPVPEGF